MFNRKVGILFVLALVSVCSAQTEDIALTLQMPDHTFSPGMPCGLDLRIQNSGPAYTDSILFVALTVGTGEYWFYPSWCKYPDSVDWEEISISQFDDTVKTILPEFPWPEGVGEFSGASFLAVVISNTYTLVSNVAEFDFGWVASAEMESMEPSSGPPGKKVVIKGTGFNLSASDIRFYIDGKDFPVFSKGIQDDGKDFVVGVIPPLSPGDYACSLKFDGAESNSLQLTIEDTAPTGKPLGEVINDIQHGMTIIGSVVRDQIIPDAAGAGLIGSGNIGTYQSTIDRANQMFGLFYSEFQNMDAENQMYLESILVQNGVDEIFSEMTTAATGNGHRGASEVEGSDLMLTLDLTSACLSALDTAWSSIDFATFAGVLVSGDAALPASVVSLGMHLTIKVIDSMIDGGFPTELKQVYLAGVSSEEYIQLNVNTPREFTMMGTLGSQEDILQTTVGEIAESCLADMGEWLPEADRAKIVQNVLDVLSGMGLESGMSFLGDDFTQIGGISDMELPLGFEWFTAAYDLGSLLGRTMFQGCADAMLELLSTYGGYSSSSGVTDTCSGCIDVDFDYERMTLTANGGAHHQNYDELAFQWYAYEPGGEELEFPNSDPSTHKVEYGFQINDAPEETSTPTPTYTPFPPTPTQHSTYTPFPPTFTPTPPSGTATPLPTYTPFPPTPTQHSTYTPFPPTFTPTHPSGTATPLPTYTPFPPTPTQHSTYTPFPPTFTPNAT